MKRFYENVVKYDRIGETESVERVTEKYLVNAVSCTDAEASLIKDLEPFIKGQCDVTSVVLSKYIDFIPENEIISTVDGQVKRTMNQNSNASDEADKYFAAKVSIITIPEGKSKKKKKTPYNYIVHATSVDAANDTVVQFMKGSLCDWEINGVTETKIIDVIQPASEEE
jgi:hypothetical protein